VLVAVVLSFLFLGIISTLWSNSTASPKKPSISHGTNQLATFGDETQIIFPYPSQTSLTSIVICNYAGEDYWYQGKETGKEIHIPSVKMGDTCKSIPLSEACKDSSCWQRGNVKPCSAAESCTERQITAGVNVISGGGGSSTCIIRCPNSKLMCQAATAVFISPADCEDVKVIPQSSTTSLFPAPYSNLPLLAFPYPSNIKPSSVAICNHSGKRYWYSWDDSTETQWLHGPGHTMIPPLQPGEKCLEVETALSWHRGFIAPCPKTEKECFRQNVRSVVAGVNVLHASQSGQAACVVHCNAAVDTCRTASVVMISPSKCERVRVTAG